MQRNTWKYEGIQNEYRGIPGRTVGIPASNVDGGVLFARLVPCNCKGSGERNGMRIYTHANNSTRQGNWNRRNTQEHERRQQNPKGSKRIKGIRGNTNKHTGIQTEFEGNTKEYKGTPRDTREQNDIQRNTGEPNGIQRTEKEYR